MCVVSLFYMNITHKFAWECVPDLEAAVHCPAFNGTRLSCVPGCLAMLAPQDDFATVSSLSVLSTMLMFFKALYYLRPYRAVGSLVKALFRIIFDVRHFFILMLMFIFATHMATVALAPSLYPANALETPYDFTALIARLTSLAVGDWGSVMGIVVDPQNSYSTRGVQPADTISPGLTNLLYVIFVFMIPIVMLNLLIAIMSDSYAAIQENSTSEFLLEKAKALAEIECFMSPAERSRKDWFPNYLHLLIQSDAVEGTGFEQKEEWTGMVHRITTEIAKVVKAQTQIERHRVAHEKSLNMLQEQSRLKQIDDTAQIQGLNRKADQLQNDLREIKAQVSALAQA